jgi:hypothetical protein
MVLTLLSDYTNCKMSDYLFNDLIKFGIRLLEDGNKEV